MHITDRQCLLFVLIASTKSSDTVYPESPRLALSGKDLESFIEEQKPPKEKSQYCSSEVRAGEKGKEPAGAEVGRKQQY